MMEEMVQTIEPTAPEPPRIAELRDAMASTIPCESRYEIVARRELAALPFGLLIAQYMNWVQRFVPQRPRKVEYAAEFMDSPVTKSHGGVILELMGHIERGEDLTPFLSNSIHRNGYVPQQARAKSPPLKRKWKDKDFALNAFGVHHLHVSAAVTPDGKVSRGPEVVFVEFTRDVARFPLAGNHNDFHGEALARAIAVKRAQSGFTLKGLRGPRSEVPHADLDALASAGYATTTTVGDEIVPLAFISGDGTPSFLIQHINLVRRAIAWSEPQIENPAWVRTLFDSCKTAMLGAPRFEWILNHTALFLGESVSKTHFQMVAGYR
jgi:hypothetical protein